MATPSKIVNVDKTGYSLATEAGDGLDHDQITVDDQGVELTAGLTDRRKLFIKVLEGEKDIFVGGSSVTPSNGYLMKPNDELWLPVGPSAEVHAVTATGDQSVVAVLETG